MARRLTPSVAAAALLMAGCGQIAGLGSRSGDALHADSVQVGGSFPPGFLWGVATAGYQSEGGDNGSNWKPWEEGGKLAQPRLKAVDFWNRYAEDMDLAKGMRLNAFRMSVEWSRVEPRPGRFDAAVLARYRTMIDAARARGLEPIVTLQHFVYPAWLDTDLDPDGFENPAVADHFSRYVRRVAQELRGRVRYWITINEPNVLSVGSYGVGFFPPGHVGWGPYTRAVSGIVTSHRAAYKVLHEVDPKNQVSSNVFYLYADSPTKYDPGKIWSAGTGPGLDLALFANARSTNVTQVPGRLAGPYIEDLGAEFMDYVAIDYYWGMATSATFNVRKPYLWPVSPKGLQDACKDLWDTYRKPILIAENGLATKNREKRGDGWTREAFLVHHLYHLRAAIQKGAKVLGYVHWSITDNYEWGDWTPRFGLYSVDGLEDPKLERKPTPAVALYRDIAGQNGLPSKYVWKYMGFGNETNK